jgi:hypothetical protein
MIETLMHLPLQSQDQLLLLRRSIQKKLAHLPRCVEYPAIEGPLTQLEDSVEDAVLSLVGCYKETVSEECRQQLALPLRCGGFGLERFQGNDFKALAAYISGAAVAQAALKGAPLHMLPFVGESGRTLTAYVCLLQRHTENDLLTDVTEVDDDLIRCTLPVLQSVYGRRAAGAAEEELFEAYDPETRSGAAAIARLRSCSGAGPSAWLEAMPTGPRTRLSNVDIRFAVRLRLGLDTMPAHAVGRQCACGRHIQADDADHALTCRSTGGAGTMRHDYVNDVWCHLARLAGVASTREPVLRQLQRRAQEEGRAVRLAGQEDRAPGAVAAGPPAAAAAAGTAEIGGDGPPANAAAAVDDIVDDAVRRARAGGAGDIGLDVAKGARGDAILIMPEGTLISDVSIIHPAAETYVEAASKATGAAAALRDAHKIELYAQSPRAGALEFVPLSMETYGRMGAPAMALLRKLAELAADTGRVDKQRWMKSALQKLSVALQRGNTWRFKAGLSVGARAPGKLFQPGLTAPTVSSG